MSLKLGHLLSSVFLVASKKEYTVTHLAQTLYLLDREAIKRFGLPIVDNDRVYTTMGPCHEKMYSLIIGDATCRGYGWASLLQETEGGTLVLADPELALEDLDELSEADIELVREVAARGKSENELSFWLDDMDNVPELAYLSSSPHPVEIPLESIMAATGLGCPEEAAEDYRGLMRSLDLLGCVRRDTNPEGEGESVPA